MSGISSTLPLYSSASSGSGPSRRARATIWAASSRPYTSWSKITASRSVPRSRISSSITSVSSRSLGVRRDEVALAARPQPHGVRARAPGRDLREAGEAVRRRDLQHAAPRSSRAATRPSRRSRARRGRRSRADPRPPGRRSRSRGRASRPARPARSRTTVRSRILSPPARPPASSSASLAPAATALPAGAATPLRGTLT